MPGQKECTIGVHRHHLYGKYKGVGYIIYYMLLCNIINIQYHIAGVIRKFIARGRLSDF